MINTPLRSDHVNLDDKSQSMLSPEDKDISRQKFPPMHMVPMTQR